VLGATHPDQRLHGAFVDLFVSGHSVERCVEHVALLGLLRGKPARSSPVHLLHRGHSHVRHRTHLRCGGITPRAHRHQLGVALSLLSTALYLRAVDVRSGR
jgi:hypothetical protein